MAPLTNSKREFMINEILQRYKLDALKRHLNKKSDWDLKECHKKWQSL